VPRRANLASRLIALRSLLKETTELVYVYALHKTKKTVNSPAMMP